MTGHPPTSCHTCIIIGQSAVSSPVQAWQTHHELFQHVAVRANDLHRQRISFLVVREAQGRY